jgi:hypothetical protein
MAIEHLMNAESLNFTYLQPVSYGASSKSDRECLRSLHLRHARLRPQLAIRVELGPSSSAASASSSHSQRKPEIGIRASFYHACIFLRKFATISPAPAQG